MVQRLDEENDSQRHYQIVHGHIRRVRHEPQSIRITICYKEALAEMITYGRTVHIPDPETAQEVATIAGDAVPISISG